MDISRLVLGTVQLGLPYGVANRRGQPGPDQARSIIQTAFKQGIRIFDTAQAYGESESVLGRCFQDLGISDKVKVISKLHPDLNYADSSCLSASVRASLKKLGVDSLYGLMLHRACLLGEWDKGLGASLLKLKRTGLVNFLGVSVYTPQEAHEALDIDEIDLIQSPFNIFDRRLIFSGVFERASQLKKRLFLRSIFLQGLLLMSPEHLPEHLYFARPALGQLKAFCLKHGLDRQELAINYAWSRAGEGSMVIGVESQEQLRENIKLVLKPGLDQGILAAWDSLEVNISPKLINPCLWNT